MLIQGEGANDAAIFYLFPRTNTGAAANSYVSSSWAGGGMTFRCPRDVGTHGFNFTNQAGTTLSFIDSVSGDLTNRGAIISSGTSPSFALANGGALDVVMSMTATEAFQISVGGGAPAISIASDTKATTVVSVTETESKAAAIVGLTLNLSVPDSTAVIASFDTEIIDAKSAWSVCSYTVPVSGVYAIEAQVLWAADADGQRVLELYVNGGSLTPGTHGPRLIDVQPGNASVQTVNHISGLRKFTAGDVLSFGLTQTAGGALEAPAGLSGASIYIVR